MPQLDKYIFLNQVLALIFFFFLTYIYIRSTVIPNLNMSLKYRHKRFAILFSHERGNWNLFKQSKNSFSNRAVNQLNFISNQLSTIFSQYKIEYNKNFNWLFNVYSSSKYLYLLANISKTKKFDDFFKSFIIFYNKYNTTSLNVISIFSNKNYHFFSQEQFNLFLIKEIIRSTHLTNSLN